jgi:hypothetical protein
MRMLFVVVAVTYDARGSDVTDPICRIRQQPAWSMPDLFP